jgi:translation initiation factor IF-2
VESEEKAEELVERRAALEKENKRSDAAPDNVELHIPGMRSRDNARLRRVLDKADLKEGDGVIRIPVVVKADAGGSLSAIRDSLINLGKHSKQKVIIDAVVEGIGDITFNDIQMAKESNAVIFSFGNKRVDQAILNLADSENVKIYSNPIIYSLLDEAKIVLGAYLPQTSVEHVHGSATVQAIFSVGTDDGEDQIAGLKVLDGRIYNDKTKVGSVELKCHFRVMRNGSQVSPEGETVRASSLRRYKELVESVRLGDECGLGLKGFSDFKEGDTIECYSVERRNVQL